MGRGLVVGLPEATGDRDPIELFGEWFSAAERSGLLLPEAAALATSTPDGAPSVRMILLKGFGSEGFDFFTNYGSRKAQELEANPRAALVFHWSVLQRQVRVEGPASRLSVEASAAYFGTRPRGSRIGAWASKQSRPLPQRAELEERMKHYEKRFSDDDVPLPPFWGGYRVRPERLELWQGRADRLHDRLCFVRDEEGWRSFRLYP